MQVSELPGIKEVFGILVIRRCPQHADEFGADFTAIPSLDQLENNVEMILCHVTGIWNLLLSITTYLHPVCTSGASCKHQNLHLLQKHIQCNCISMKISRAPQAAG